VHGLHAKGLQNRENICHEMSFIKSKIAKAIWDGSRPLENCFGEAAADATRACKKRAEYTGLCNVLTCEFQNNV
jgi:hypothetical protein